MSSNHVAIFMSDFYKQAHAEQYPKGLSKLVSYETPRKTRLKNDNSLVVIGIQAFTRKFLIEQFNDTFFSMAIEDIEKEFNRVIGSTLSKEYANFDKWRDLWELGYLPLEIKALDEGTLCPMGVPFIEVSNTHPNFAWLVEFIESKMSNDTWYPMCVAKRAYNYRKIVNEHYDKTVGIPELRKSAISEFGYRGGEGEDGSAMATGAFLTSFNKTATIPGLLWLEDNYNCDISDGTVGSGMISTEHSVMCSNFAVDGDEKTFLKRLITELYPTGNLSIVIDSYDHHKTLSELICGELKDDILSRDGTLFIRGDSGNPIDIICGENSCRAEEFSSEEELAKAMMGRDKGFNKGYKLVGKVQGKLMVAQYTSSNTSPLHYTIEVEPYQFTPADYGMVECLWNAFGGTINKLGYKVLDTHIRAIYGDSITPARADEIYTRLEFKGFAACNVALGAGSFSMQCVDEEEEQPDGTKLLKMIPFTRDTYGIAVKATYAELSDGTMLQLFKDPKTDTEKLKKSHKGMCKVYRDIDGDIRVQDGYNSKSNMDGNLLKTIFLNGYTMHECSIHDIRKRLWGDQF